MRLKHLRQILKGLADDTRLRILNLLQYRELTVKDICKILNMKQPTISKHLIRLRLLRIVDDRRHKNYVYYGLNLGSEQAKIMCLVLSKFNSLEIFKNDIARIKSLSKRSNE